MLEYMSGKFLEVKIVTNATKLTEELSHHILTTGVNLLVFSVDAHTKEVYESIRVRGNFDEVYGNIKQFHDIREKYYPDSNLNTRVSAVMFREDQDPEEFVKFWPGIIDEVGAKQAAFRWNTYTNPLQPDLNTPCWLLWERLYIWWDGTTNPCDADYKSLLTPGNVRENSIHEIWHGKKLTQLREAHINSRRNEYEPCDRCGLRFE
jgi:radical SAM protein with 4Fe4S-binding SPASM domain